LPGDLVIVHAVTASLTLLAWWLDQGTALGPQAMGAIIDCLVMEPVRRR
jgi:hypothetical protein